MELKPLVDMVVAVETMTTKQVDKLVVEVVIMNNHLQQDPMMIVKEEMQVLTVLP